MLGPTLGCCEIEGALSVGDEDLEGAERLGSCDNEGIASVGPNDLDGYRLGPPLGLTDSDGSVKLGPWEVEGLVSLLGAADATIVGT